MKNAAATYLVLAVAACVAVGVALLLLEPQPESSPVRPDAGVDRNAASSSLLSAVSTEPATPRSVVPTEHESRAVPSADVAATVSMRVDSPPDDPDLAAMRTELESLRNEIHRLKCELEQCRMPAEASACRDLARKFDECRFAEITPIGALIRVPEYEELSEKDRREVQYTLDDYPVLLQAGEAAWIAERWRQDDWHMYGRNVREALILFLGPARVAREMPPDKLAELRGKCDDLEWARLFGNR